MHNFLCSNNNNNKVKQNSTALNKGSNLKRKKNKQSGKDHYFAETGQEEERFKASKD